MSDQAKSTQLLASRFYPWLIAFFAMTILLVTNGLTTTALSAFDEALLKEFGWGRGELKFRDAITLITAGLLAPLAGVLIDRFGTRRLLLFGSALFAILYFAYGTVDSLMHLYLLHAGFGVVLVCAGVSVSVITVSQWFVRARGTAVGIALVGSSLGGVIFPPMILALINGVGWRNGFMWMACWAVLLLLLTWLIAYTPRDKNLRPLGDGEPHKGAASAPSPNDLTYAETIRTKSFWALCIVGMASFYSILAIAAHIFLYMRDLGFDPPTAARAIGLLFGLGLISKFLFGFLTDYVNPRIVFVGNVGLMLIGLLMIASFNRDLIWVGVAVTGFGWGGLYTLIALQTVNNFGVTHSGKILGTVTMLDATAGGLGIWLTGVMFDAFGDYRIAFYVLCGLLTLAFVASTQVRREIRVRG